MGKGLQRILKIYGEMEMSDDKGNSVTHIWDYASEKPRIKGEMTKEEFAKSERAKWSVVRKTIKNETNGKTKSRQNNRKVDTFNT